MTILLVAHHLLYFDVLLWYYINIQTDFQTMSVLHHEDILEDCYLEVLEEFRTDCLFMTQDQIDALVYEKFEARCQ